MKGGGDNKFAAILQARSTTGAEPIVVPPAPSAAPAKTNTIVTPAPSKLVAKAVGRGKSSDPAFRSVTAYIPQELHSNSTIALRLANQQRADAEKEDFSELLTRLLANWYEKQTYYRPAK